MDVDAVEWRAVSCGMKKDKEMGINLEVCGV